MVIYNKNKEFIGIDEADVKALGFKNLAAMQAEAADFADLFVKTPGHIHNFKHIHWIDFVLYAKSTDESKAIIHANGNDFKVNLEIKTIYLTDAPATQAFLVILHNLKALSSDEKVEIATELQTRTSPVAKVQDEAVDIFDEDTTQTIPQNPIVDDPYVIEDEMIDIYEPSQEELAYIGDAQVDEDEVSFSFDPQKTAEVLEMPVSLIEEFIEDFINQAIEFKDKLYNAIATDDLIELQALSHKLKGVAANLRIQDALEILEKLNKSKDFTTSKQDLDTFYKIISKLSGKEIATLDAKNEDEVTKLEIQDDEDEILEIVDEEETPQIILDEIDLDDASIEDSQDEEEPLLIPDDFDLLDDAMDEIEQESEEATPLITQNYDKHSIANEIGLDHNSFHELFDEYISESQNLIMSIEDAIKTNNIEKWKNETLKLKGMSDNMRITSFTAQLEILFNTDDTKKAKDALGEIQSIIFEISKTKD